MKKKVWVVLVVVLAVGAWIPSADAVLYRVGPTDLPSPPGNGYPFWYQDATGMTLDLCLPKVGPQVTLGACGALVIPNPLAPISFPGNFPDESFYFLSQSVLVTDTGTRDNAVLVLAVEGAFATGVVSPGAQITFSRLRIVVDAPVAGNYTVTTPYGVYSFPNVAVKKRAIVFPLDIGVGPGVFTGALAGTTGPFLQASLTPGGAALPPVTIPLDPSGDLFLSDGVALTNVTGSPANTNYFQICTDAVGGFPNPPVSPPGTPAGCIRVNDFTLTGRIFNGTPFDVTKSYYLRNAAGAGTVNVFGLTSTISPTASYAESGTGLTTTTMAVQIPPGNLFVSIPFTTGTTLPATVTTTATDLGPPARLPTAISTNLVDLVNITAAVYNAATQTLTIRATSSDQLLPSPTLTATGLGPLVNGVLNATGVIAPPGTVTVTSSKGGSATATVTPGLPVSTQGAKNDFDGDGKTDISVWRPSDGIWYILGSQAGFMAQQWGLPTDIPVSGDYDGDGKIDYAVWRPSEGMWYILGSQVGFMAQQWGAPTDIPVPGDYDGDGKTDIAVWRPSEGFWYILGSQAGFMAQQWGAPTDVPLP